MDASTSCEVNYIVDEGFNLQINKHHVMNDEGQFITKYWISSDHFGVSNTNFGVESCLKNLLKK